MARKLDVSVAVVVLKRLEKLPMRYEEIRRLIAEKKETHIRTTSRVITALLANGWLKKTGKPYSNAPYVITEKGELFLKSKT